MRSIILSIGVLRKMTVPTYECIESIASRRLEERFGLVSFFARVHGSRLTSYCTVVSKYHGRSLPYLSLLSSDTVVLLIERTLVQCTTNMPEYEDARIPTLHARAPSVRPSFHGHFRSSPSVGIISLEYVRQVMRSASGALHYLCAWDQE